MFSLEHRRIIYLCVNKGKLQRLNMLKLC